MYRQTLQSLIVNEHCVTGYVEGIVCYTQTETRENALLNLTLSLHTFISERARYDCRTLHSCIVHHTIKNVYPNLFLSFEKNSITIEVDISVSHDRASEYLIDHSCGRHALTTHDHWNLYQLLHTFATQRHATRRFKEVTQSIETPIYIILIDAYLRMRRNDVDEAEERH